VDLRWNKIARFDAMEALRAGGCRVLL